VVSEEYPDFIKQLPMIDIPIAGVKGWLAQGTDFQIVFFEIDAGISIPPHKHADQFGIVFEGEMTLTLGKKQMQLKQGDSYFIPKGVLHSAIFHTFCRAMDYFAEPKRYQTR
jgi:quercetin dioxygenase-like cupin family protein